MKYCGFNRLKSGFELFEDVEPIEEEREGWWEVESHRSFKTIQSKKESNLKDTQVNWDSNGTQIKFVITIRPSLLPDPTIIWQNTRPAEFIKNRSISLVVHPFSLELQVGTTTPPSVIHVCADGFTGSYMNDGTPSERIASLQLTNINQQTATYTLLMDQMATVPLNVSLVRLRLRADDTWTYIPVSMIPEIFTLYISYLRWQNSEWRDNLRME